MGGIKMKKIKVQNMESAKGNTIPNQFIITEENNRYFQSYETVIAMIDNKGDVFLDKNDWDYSVTTSKYRNIFLKETKQETLKKIQSNEYTLIDLN